MGYLVGNRVGQSGSHGGEVPGQVEGALVADSEVACCPGRDGPRVRREDGVTVGQSVDDVHEVLRLDRILFD